MRQYLVAKIHWKVREKEFNLATVLISTATTFFALHLPRYFYKVQKEIYFPILRSKNCKSNFFHITKRNRKNYICLESFSAEIFELELFKDSSKHKFLIFQKKMIIDTNICTDPYFPSYDRIISKLVPEHQTSAA